MKRKVTSTNQSTGNNQSQASNTPLTQQMEGLRQVMRRLKAAQSSSSNDVLNKKLEQLGKR